MTERQDGTTVVVRYYEGSLQAVPNAMTGAIDSQFVRASIIEDRSYFFPAGEAIDLNKDYGK